MDLFVQMIDFAIETAIYVRSFKMITKNNELFTMLQIDQTKYWFETRMD